MFHRTLQRVSDAASSLSVMQLNTLSRKLQPDPVDGSDAAAAAMCYDHRMTRLLEHITALQPTVLVLQEVDDPAVFFAPKLIDEGYDYVADRKSGGAQDHTCIFYKRAVQLCRPPTTRRFTETGSQFVLMAHFRQSEGGVEFAVVAQHAKAGRTDEMEALRLEHAKMVVGLFVPEWLAGHEDTIGGRLLWVGDFNAGPHTYGGKYPAAVLPWLLDGEDRPLRWKSAVVDASGAHSHLTTCKARKGTVIAQTIDYILFIDGVCCCVAFLASPIPQTEDVVTDVAALAPLYLPNADWGSDHLSVYCELLWR
jgi:endonuclease/exonuclease/phosphatase family metal-dependent hydrolase